MKYLFPQTARGAVLPIYLHFMKRLFINKRFYALLTGLIIMLAFSGGIMLLIYDIPNFIFQRLEHAPLSAAPLLLIGLASLCFQAIIRPKLLDFLKALIVSSAFILWGVDQLLTMGWLATTLGDVVIALYVIDLGWMMLEHLVHKHVI